ncbi:MAG TPA: hypothetical protein VJG32_13255 [Anaerolineae bacterium]|nr:hypothetical protein [Anaerolineae bacterium]
MHCSPPAAALQTQRRHVFTQQCAAGHALIADTIIVGPLLAGIASRSGARLPDLDAVQYIEWSILKPD